jgi:enolase-phosphatase E1
VAAQKLVFGHTSHGDLTHYFSHYFDTTVGGKKEVTSYQAIAKALQLPPQAILFLSDMEPELEAAEEAGYQVIQLQRDDDVISGHVPYPVKRSFDSILP